MLRIYVMEDNRSYREKIVKAINEIVGELNVDIEVMFSVKIIKQLLYSIDLKYTNIYFLDIGLNYEINGIELAELIRKIDSKGFIVYLSTYKEIPKYKDGKSIGEFIINDNYNNIKENINKSLLRIFEDKRTGESININLNGENVIMLKGNILFIEKVKKYIIIHTNKKQFVFYGEIKDIQKKVGNGFIVLNRNMLINTARIRKIEKADRKIIMDNNEEIKLGLYTYYRRYKNIKGLL